MGTIEFYDRKSHDRIFHGFQLILSYSADGGASFTIEPGFYRKKCAEYDRII